MKHTFLSLIFFASIILVVAQTDTLTRHEIYLSDGYINDKVKPTKGKHLLVEREKKYGDKKTRTWEFSLYDSELKLVKSTEVK